MAKVKQNELENFEVPIVVDSYKGIDFHILPDCNLIRKLPLEIFLKHEGFEMIFNNKKINLTIKPPKDSLKLRISPPQRYGHFYGWFYLPSIGIKLHSGSSHEMPRFFDEVELTRPITLEEIEMNEERLEGQEIGSPTLSFESYSAVLAHANEVATRYFPGFKIIVLE